MDKKIVICRVLHKKGEWSNYRIDIWKYQNHITSLREDKINLKYQSPTLKEMIDYFSIKEVRELGVRYSYNDNLGEKYGIEEWEAFL